LKGWLSDPTVKDEALKALRVLALKVPVDVPDVAPGSLLTPLNFLPHRINNHRSEACAVADFNGDGKLDIAAGPFLYLAPDWKPIQIREVSTTVNDEGKGYADDFCNLVVDVNQDGRPDIIRPNAWFEAPKDLRKGAWIEHPITLGGKDGNKEIVTGKRFMAHNGGDPDEFGKQCIFYYRFTPGPNPVFRKHVISYDEGIGAGLNTVAVDMDGDGDLDLVTTGKWGGPILFENRMTEPVSAEARREGLRPLASAAAPAAQTFGDNLALASRVSRPTV